MKVTSRKAITWLLCLWISLIFIPCAASAESSIRGDNDKTVNQITAALSDDDPSNGDEITTWTELQTALNDGRSTVTLTQDIIAGNSVTGPLTVSAGTTVTLNLNGHTISRELADKSAVTHGNVITVYGNLTVNGSDGMITGGNNNGNGGAVYVYGGTFKMSGNVTISGNVATQKGGGVYIEVSADSVSSYFTMNGGNIIGNTATDGGAVYKGPYCDFSMYSGNITENAATKSGGAVFASGGPFTMSGGTIFDNTASFGGAVYVYGGTFNMYDGSVISDNTSDYFGAVYVCTGTFPASGGSSNLTSSGTFNMYGGSITGSNVSGVYVSGGPFTMTGGSITGNSDGGVYFSGNTFRMRGGSITGNTAIYNGGGVTVEQAKFIMSRGVISGNTAGSNYRGGGVYVLSSTCEISGGSITDNEAGAGGGVYSDGTVTMTGGSITGNRASKGGGAFVNSGQYYASGSGYIQNSFTMSGGDITDNSANENGAGVYVKGIFSLSGSPIISGNLKGEEDNNVYLSSNEDSSALIHIADMLTEGSSIGISMQTPGIFTDGLSGRGTLSNFTSDSDAYAIQSDNDSGEVRLAIKYYVTLPTGLKGGSVTADKQSALQGEIVTLSVVLEDGYELDTLTVKDVDGNEMALTDSCFTMPASDVTVSMSLIPPHYTIAYDANGGTGAPANQTKTHDIALTLSSETPTRVDSNAGSYTVTFDPNGGSVSTSSLSSVRTTSYIFQNWNTAANGNGTSYAPGAIYTANAETTLYAQWFSSTTAETLTLPTPVRTGYTFKGWTTDSSASAGITGIYLPPGDVTLYAVWEIITYSVAYDANGGDGAPSNQTKTYGVDLILSGTIPTRANSSPGSFIVTLNANGGSISTSTLTAVRTTSYNFKDWNTAANGGGTSYISGASYTANAAVTLYAQWNDNTDTAAVTLPTPTRTGYSFMGWATSSSAADGITGSYTPTGNVTLYAIWKPDTYAVSYNANGGTGAPASQTKTHNIALTLSYATPTRANIGAGSCTITLNANGGSVSQSTLTASRTTQYTFRNWNTAANGGGTSYAPGARYTANASVTLYAQWISSTTASSVMLPTPIRDGYSFLGWGTSSSATSGTIGSYSPTGDITLYAVWEANSYVVSYEANGGMDAPASQMKTHGITLKLSTAMPTHANSSAGSYTVTLNANGGSVSQSTLTASRTTQYTFRNWNTAANGGGTSYAPGASYTANADMTLYAQWDISTTTAAVTLPTPTRTGYAFLGWSTSISSTSGITGSYTPNANVTLYAIWEKKETYTVTYNANGGTGTPSTQEKEEDVPLLLSSLEPSKYYYLQYNATGGTVSPASKNVYCTFENWNTAANGSGTAYAPSSIYTANANVTLYAQWTNPAAGTLATPSRSGYEFNGWFTSASGGVQITTSSIVTGNLTIYAHWTESANDPYNMGDETYSFENYGDADSLGGHCFGMSMTSAGYHNGLLDIGRIGGNASTPLYSFRATATVKKPICYYQSVQGTSSNVAIVAGGSSYLYGYSNIASDWQAVVNYVRDHSYDNTGMLQIGFRKNGIGGHAINFLRYENVNGQDRIYAYDNNFPTQETYFYRDSQGRVWMGPVQTFSGTIDCIALRDCRIYFSRVGDFDATHALYMAKSSASVQGYSYSAMDGSFSDEEYGMYEIPASQDRVVIVPHKDYADFIYMDTGYSFGEITDDTRGELKFATMDEGSGSLVASFQIYEIDPEFGEPDFTLPLALTEIEDSAFDGITATSVYVPDSCTSIGPYAFRNAAITRIRIPSGCTIADTAFEGCARVKIFGTAGSAAEAFCSSHDNCTFVTEEREVISEIHRAYASANLLEN